jgi:hypothetical protein
MVDTCSDAGDDRYEIKDVTTYNLSINKIMITSLIFIRIVQILQLSVKVFWYQERQV